MTDETKLRTCTAELILPGFLTIRTFRTSGLVSVGEKIELVGAVQTLGGVLGRSGAGGTEDTCAVVLRVTNTIQEVAGGTSEPLSVGPGSLRTLETALGVGIENMVGQAAVQALGGVSRARPETIVTTDEAARFVEAGLSLETD